jgi:hypothetical protein
MFFQQVLSIPSEWPAAFDTAAADIFSWARYFFQQALPMPSDGPAASSAASADLFSWAHHPFSAGSVDTLVMASCISCCCCRRYLRLGQLFFLI